MTPQILLRWCGRDGPRIGSEKGDKEGGERKAHRFVSLEWMESTAYFEWKGIYNLHVFRCAVVEIANRSVCKQHKKTYYNKGSTRVWMSKYSNFKFFEFS